MTNNFLNNARLGKNEWWRYLLSILAPIVSIALLNVIVRQVLPELRTLFPDNEFGSQLGTFLLVMVVFGAALLTFTLVASKLHQRSIASFINTDGKFSWSYYCKGFLTWGILLFIGALITDYAAFDNFLQNFNAFHFILTFATGFVAIGVQSFFEEIVIRGYWLQGLHLRIKNTTALVLINALIFGVLHFGYGVDSFISSWAFGIAFAVIVILQHRIEFVAGAHNANNLILSLVFLDLSEAVNEGFNWTINWSEMIVTLAALLILVGLVRTFFRTSA